jgi:hypothetical protein
MFRLLVQSRHRSQQRRPGRTFTQSAVFNRRSGCSVLHCRRRRLRPRNVARHHKLPDAPRNFGLLHCRDAGRSEAACRARTLERILFGASFTSPTVIPRRVGSAPIRNRMSRSETAAERGRMASTTTTALHSVLPESFGSARRSCFWQHSPRNGISNCLRARAVCHPSEIPRTQLVRVLSES